MGTWHIYKMQCVVNLINSTKRWFDSLKRAVHLTMGTAGGPEVKTHCQLALAGLSWD